MYLRHVSDFPLLASALMLCRVLRSADELDEARLEYQRRQLCHPTDGRKAWDNLIALEALKRVSPDESIVDVGCRNGILLTWLYQEGYRSLWGCDLKTPLPALTRAVARGYPKTLFHGAVMYAKNRRRMRRSPAEDTKFPTAEFAAVTSMSVIEHAVETHAFFREASRMLRQGGILFLSTDYWSESRVTDSGDCVFGPQDINRLLDEAASVGLVPLCQPDLQVESAVIAEGSLEYTFLTLAFERSI